MCQAAPYRVSPSQAEGPCGQTWLAFSLSRWGHTACMICLYSLSLACSLDFCLYWERRTDFFYLLHGWPAPPWGISWLQLLLL